MKRNVTQKLLAAHGVAPDAEPGSEVAVRIDQTLTQDATGTMVMLELEAMGLERVATEVSAQYIDHNLLQTDFRNPDDHVFLRSACRRFGIWYSGPGNGVSHPVHMERLGRPGATMVGSDSHTPAAGALGMLAMGAGGLEVALAMAGEAYSVAMPEVWGVRLTGRLPAWVSAKDVVLEMLRRHGVDGGLGRVVEYHGPGLAELSAMDRHVIANMGTELGATSTVFPADEAVKAFLAQQGRASAYQPWVADQGAGYDVEETIDLSTLAPLVARPSSPGDVVPVAEVAGLDIYQAYVGSSANPGFRDFAAAADIVAGRRVADGVSWDINPTSRQILENLIASGHLAKLVRSGARLHQTGCNGCIGMGQAPASGRASVRTVPRNFPGRSGTKDDRVYLASPETAAASALTGVLTDPRTLEAKGIKAPGVAEPEPFLINDALLEAPESSGAQAKLVMGPNIHPLPEFEPLPKHIKAPVLLKLGDDVSTDEILPAGQRVLPFRSNIPAISRFAFAAFDEGFGERARSNGAGGFFVVGGKNYGQGSSREHAAIAPRYLGLRAVVAKGFARIHAQNLANFGVLPLVFEDPEDYERVERGHVLELSDVPGALAKGRTVVASNATTGQPIRLRHGLSPRQVEAVRAGSLLSLKKKRPESA